MFELNDILEYNIYPFSIFFQIAAVFLRIILYIFLSMQISSTQKTILFN